MRSGHIHLAGIQQLSRGTTSTAGRCSFKLATDLKEVHGDLGITTVPSRPGRLRQQLMPERPPTPR
jgi:hypothetical protein